MRRRSGKGDGIKRVYSLEELLAGITPENRHELIDWGPPVGREFTGDAWEECQPGTNPRAGFDPPPHPDSPG
jgi:hypothetical protein